MNEIGRCECTDEDPDDLEETALHLIEKGRSVDHMRQDVQYMYVHVHTGFQRQTFILERKTTINTEIPISDFGYWHG